MKITIDCVGCSGDKVEVTGVILQSRFGVEQLIMALRAAADQVWPPKKEPQK